MLERVLFRRFLQKLREALFQNGKERGREAEEVHGDKIILGDMHKCLAIILGVGGTVRGFKDF
ncbi:hypothetical protein SDC9_131109 [bioreactor metagenome]|uniref:Uncharacterized protein n=1 Tax=bioreactor metagenome TaxID=1076179 RepID=A0A645D4P7_9ZZZZ